MIAALIALVAILAIYCAYLFAANYRLECERAQALGIAAGMRFSEAGITVRLTARAPFFVPPGSLSVTLSHPTRAGLDQTLELQRKGEYYQGDLKLPSVGHWVVLLKDREQTWRLMGNVVLPAAGETILGGELAGQQSQ